jgi:hypothetical protein
MTTYKAGTKVFCDFHFGGKPKGKVIEVIEPGNGQSTNGCCRVQLTETQGAYRKGELLEVQSCYCVPVKQELKLRAGQYFRRINTQYEWVK